MAENSGDLSLGYMMGQSEGGNGGFGNFGEGIWAVIILAILFGRGGFGGLGGFGGGGGEGVSAGFAWQGIDNGIRGIQQGLCDGFYAVNTGMLNGFHGVDNAICTLGYNTQSGFNSLSHQLSDCCCTTQRAIDGVNYNMAKGFCDLGTVISASTRDIMESNNANFRDLKDFLVAEKMAAKDARIASLEGALGRAEDRSFLAANQEAQTAEIFRRFGLDRQTCAIPAYVVPNPNCCYGNPAGIGYGGNGGCGCGF